MADVFNAAARSAVMRAVRSTDTVPEIRVRRLVHGMGYRFRLHNRSLPGCPDLTFAWRRKVIFVHGCFWHRHACEAGRSFPSSRVEYWTEKLARNRRRDALVRRRLRRLGWSVLVVWECWTKPARAERLKERIAVFLGGSVVSQPRNPLHPARKPR